MDKHRIYREWLRLGLKKPGKTQNGLARALNRDPMAVSRLVNEKRNFHLADLPKISSYIEEPVPQPPGGPSPNRRSVPMGIRTVGRVGASVWHDGTADLGVVSSFDDPRFPPSDQCAFAIDQDQPASNLNRGSTVMTVDYQKYNHYAGENSFGIFEKKQGNLINYQIAQIGSKKQAEPTRLVIAALHPLI